MKDFNEFMDTRKDLNQNFKLKNIISGIFLFGLLYQMLNYSHNVYWIITSVTVILCAYIFIIKVRYVYAVRRNNQELHSYIQEAIKLARLKDDYSVLNKLLDTKYTSHVILLMSKLPKGCFDYSKLEKWTNLSKAISYFKEEEFTTEDLLDSVKMMGYMRHTTPDLFKN